MAGLKEMLDDWNYQLQDKLLLFMAVVINWITQLKRTTRATYESIYTLQWDLWWYDIKYETKMKCYITYRGMYHVISVFGVLSYKQESQCIVNKISYSRNSRRAQQGVGIHVWQMVWYWFPFTKAPFPWSYSGRQSIVYLERYCICTAAHVIVLLGIYSRYIYIYIYMRPLSRGRRKIVKVVNASKRSYQTSSLSHKPEENGWKRKYESVKNARNG